SSAHYKFLQSRQDVHESDAPHQKFNHEARLTMFKFVLRLSDTAQADALFSEAYACLDQGLCYEEDNDRVNAASMYERALNLIAEAEKSKNAKKSELYKHLMEAKPSAAHRLKVLEKEIAENRSEKVGGVDDEKHEKAKSELRDCLEGVGDAEADVIFSIPDGVQLFSIDGDETTVPTYPTSLQILRFNATDPTSKLPRAPADALIQVGPWVYPLVTGKTPVLHNDFGAYVVPNPTQDHPNLAVAIILPADAGPQVEEEFRQILGQFADVRDQDLKKELSEEDSKHISKKIAKLLITAWRACSLGSGNTAAVKVTSYLDDKGEKYVEFCFANSISFLQVSSWPGSTESPMTINPALKGSLVYMHKGSKLVAKCTRYLLDKIGDAGIAIGRSLASGAERTLGKGSGGGLVTGTISVIGGGIVGVSTVWMALEDNSRTLCRNIADQTVRNVKIKYGDEASEAAHHALFAAGHSSLAAAQLWDLGPRSIAGRMAKRAGVQSELWNYNYRKKNIKLVASETSQDQRFVISDEMNGEDKAIEEASEEVEQDDEDEAGQSTQKEGGAGELNDDDDDIDNPGVQTEEIRSTVFFSYSAKIHAIKRNKNAKTIENRYLEGWLEVKRKKVAKALAARFDNSPVGGKKRDYTSSVLWNIKYLSSFKWVHLMEQLQYERTISMHRMSAEIAQARRVAAHFEEQVDKGRHLKRLEEKALKAGGLWNKFQREIEQRKVVKKSIKKKLKSKQPHSAAKDEEVLKMIFAE
ncbi:hypothetical protein OSTOST_14411, partial [Ostertagia ostertagi]